MLYDFVEQVKEQATDWELFGSVLLATLLD
jgi:hypothetical protein